MSKVTGGIGPLEPLGWFWPAVGRLLLKPYYVMGQTYIMGDVFRYSSHNQEEIVALSMNQATCLTIRSHIYL